MAFATRLWLLLLIPFIEGTKAFNLRRVVAKSHVLSSHAAYHVMAPQLFRNGSFAFATIVQASQRNKDKIGIDILVTIADKYSANYSKCSLALEPDNANDNSSSVTVTSLNRLNRQKVVLMGYEVHEDEKRKGFLIALDVKSCETLYLYSSFDLVDNHALVTRENSDKFEIFTNGRSTYPACSGAKTRITFKEGDKEFHCFDVDVGYRSNMHVGVFSFSEDVVMVRGFDAAANYRVLVYNSRVYPYRQQLWLTLPYATDKTKVVSSDLAVCWLFDPDVDKSIHCSLIDKSGYLRLNVTVHYDEPMKLLSVSQQSDTTMEIILLTEKSKCDGDDCTNVFVSKVTDKSIDHRAIKLDCSTLDEKRLTLNARRVTSKGAITLEYICEASNRFVLHAIDIDDS